MTFQDYISGGAMKNAYIYEKIKSRIYPIFQADMGAPYKVQIYQLSSGEWGFVILENERPQFESIVFYGSREECIAAFERAD